LQDVHWSAGLWGYFPTYTLGNLVAAQLRDSMERDLGSLDELLRLDRQSEVLGWLRHRIHRKGRMLSPSDLVIEATGRPLSAEPFLKSMQNKLLQLGWIQS
jgi:carboxypeptidase Taq